MIIYCKGNLVDAWLKGEVNALIHCCNCFNTMGSGIALEVRKRIPGAFAVDNATQAGDMDKLGGYTMYTDNRGSVVFNVYGQYRYGRDRKHLDEDALREGLEGVNDFLSFCSFVDWKIGIPRIGCGSAGGDWNVVKEVVKNTIGHYNVFVYDL